LSDGVDQADSSALIFCTVPVPTPNLVAILRMPTSPFLGALRIAVCVFVSIVGRPSLLPCACARSRHDKWFFLGMAAFHPYDMLLAQTVGLTLGLRYLMHGVAPHMCGQATLAHCWTKGPGVAPPASYLLRPPRTPNYGRAFTRIVCRRSLPHEAQHQIRRRLLQRGSYCRAGADLLEIAADDVLALGDTFEHRDEAAIGGAERNKALIGLVAFANDVDIFAKLT